MHAITALLGLVCWAVWSLAAFTFVVRLLLYAARSRSVYTIRVGIVAAMRCGCGLPAELLALLGRWMCYVLLYVCCFMLRCLVVYRQHDICWDCGCYVSWLLAAVSLLVVRSIAMS